MSIEVGHDPYLLVVATHQIVTTMVTAMYGEPAATMTIECRTCGTVLVSADKEEDLVPIFEDPKVYSFTQPAMIVWESYEDGTIISMDVSALDAPEMWSECDEAPEFGGENYDEWVQVMYRMTANIKHYEPFQNVPEGIRFSSI